MNLAKVGQALTRRFFDEFRYRTAVTLLALGRLLLRLSQKAVNTGWNVYFPDSELKPEKKTHSDIVRYCAECESEKLIAEPFCVHEMDAISGAFEGLETTMIN